MTTLAAEANRPLDYEGGCIVVLDSSGDTKHIWDRNVPAEVEEARALFKRMQERGMQAWSVTRRGDKDQRITTFDPEAEKIIFAPALQGG